MTEQEAKTKWCPMYRSTDNGELTAHATCCASDCMIWRETDRCLIPIILFAWLCFKIGGRNE